MNILHQVEANPEKRIHSHCNQRQLGIANWYTGDKGNRPVNKYTQQECQRRPEIIYFNVVLTNTQSKQKRLFSNSVMYKALTGLNNCQCIPYLEYLIAEIIKIHL